MLNPGSNPNSVLSIDMLEMYGGNKGGREKLPIPAAKCTDCANCKKMHYKKKKKQQREGWMNCVWLVSDCCFFCFCFFLLEEQCSHAAHFALLLHKDLKVLVDNGHSQEDSCTRTNGTQEIGHDRQPSYA